MKISSVLINGVIAMFFFGCEEVTIFAEPERTQTEQIETLETVGACIENEDCPQWSCVSSECVEGLCVPTRSLMPSLAMEAIRLDEPLVSITLEKDQLFALTGEITDSVPYGHSIGTGQAILSWSLSSSYPTESSSLDEIKAYEEATWQPENQWSPQLERVTLTPSLDPEEAPVEQREPLLPKAIRLQQGKLWIHAGEQARDLWWGQFGQAENSGTYFRLASPAYALTVDDEEAWVSIFDKGLERLSLSTELTMSTDDEADSSQVANARFNTPGRALNTRVGRSFVVVADGYAGLSLFTKRGADSLGTSNPARRLVTPPQELSTEGRTVHLDLIEDRVISAEFGIGVGITRINAEGGLQRELTMELGGQVRWVKWIDPYTALVWVDGRGILALDLLTADQ